MTIGMEDVLGNLSSFTTPMKGHHSNDNEYIDSSTKKIIELRIAELESSVSGSKAAEQWMKKRETRSAQIDRLNQARLNLQLLFNLKEKGVDIGDKIIDENIAILREITDIAPEEAIKKSTTPDAETILDSFHMTEKDIKNAIKHSNILDMIKKAKESGWTLKITEDGIELYDKYNKRVMLDMIDSDSIISGNIQRIDNSKHGSKKITRSKK